MHVNWPRVTDVKPELIAALTRAGLDQREARWLVDEFVVGGDPDSIPSLQMAVERRLQGEPLQYIIGHWPFRFLDLDIDSRVLIPRPETEELVGVALRELALRQVAAPRILDLGCGSGAIGLALLFELRQRGIAATLVAVDESTDALAVARSNALKHSLHAVSFVHSSWFDALDASLRGHFDLIVSNPPYVAASEMPALDPVLDHEPLGALVAEDSVVPGFSDLEVIIAGAPAWLTDEGLLVCEHGYQQRDAVLNAARSAGFASFEDVDDMAGHPRVLIARMS